MYGTRFNPPKIHGEKILFEIDCKSYQLKRNVGEMINKRIFQGLFKILMKSKCVFLINSIVPGVY